MPDFAHLKLERGGEGYRLGVSCSTLAAMLFTQPVCHPTELNSPLNKVNQKCPLRWVELFSVPAEVRIVCLMMNMWQM